MTSAANSAAADPRPTAASVMADAVAATGLRDFGADLSFRAGLDHLMADVAAMPAQSEQQRNALERITFALIMRLRIVQDDRLHPQIRAQRIVRPIVVTGLPRTGTTITVDLLARDPALRFPREWEYTIPWPATEAATIDTDPRIAIIQPTADRFLERVPELAAIHRFDSTAPAECNCGLMYHFSSTNYWAELAANGHVEWLIAQPPPGQYDDHRRLLQQMQWKGPPGRWLLKSPQHLLNLPALLDTYPDASIVWTHRDPVATFSSLASMVTLVQRVSGLDPAPHVVGAMVARIWGRALLNAVAARAADPALDRAILDQPHASVLRDPIAAIRRIYAFAGQPFTPQFQQRLDDFVRTDAKAQRAGKHRHRPEDFGLDPARIHQDLAPYYAAYGNLLT